MGMSDAQFKAFLRVALRDLMDAIEATTPEEKDAIIKSLADDFQKTLEDLPCIPHQRDRGTEVFPDLSRIDVNVDDVHLFFVEHLHHLEQCAGAVLQPDAQPRDAARAREVAQQHIGEQARVDIAAGQH